MKKHLSLLLLALLLSTTMLAGASPAIPQHDLAHESLVAASDGGQYIGNLNTHKFHYASCRYVSAMNPSNKVPFTTRDEAIQAGYVPCKVCRP